MTQGWPALGTRPAMALGAALLALVMIGTPAAPVTQAAPGSPVRVRVDAPTRGALGQPIELTLTASGADIGGYQAHLRFDRAAATFGGVQHPRDALRTAGRQPGPLRAFPADGVVFGAFSCPAPSCAAAGRPGRGHGIGGALTLAIIEVIPTQPGALELTLDDIQVVDSGGAQLPLSARAATVRVQVGNGGGAHPAPGGPRARPAAPAAGRPRSADVTADGTVTNADVVEEVFAWRRAQRTDAPCGTAAEAAHDVNGDGCLDVADVQATAAQLGAPSPTARWPRPAAAAAPLTFTVDSTADGADAAPGDGICADAGGACTLRAAIQEADNHAGPDTVAFAIPGGGVRTIQLAAQLPSLWDATGGTTIDGYTQPGAAPNTDPLADNARIMVQVRGAGADGASAFNALGIGSAGNVIRGLAFYRMKTTLDVYGAGAHDNVFAGNFIGTDAAGVDLAPDYAEDSTGITFSGGASHNRVGGSAAADRNVLSGNAESGVNTFDTETQANIIQGNLVGLAPDGHTWLGNYLHGIDINTGSSDNVIGGTGPGERNVASGNGLAGIELSHTRGIPPRGNQVIGNYVGTDVTGHRAPHSGNRQYGIYLEDSPQDNVIANNVVGNNEIGGIRIEGYTTTGNQVSHNRVGIAPDGSPIPNAQFGIQLIYDVRQTVIGPYNLIAHNPVGIELASADADFNRITRNRIFHNPGPGISLAAGANQGIAPPVLLGGTTTRARGAACTGCTVEVFSADRGTGAAGQGQWFVGSGVAGADGAFTAHLSGVSAGQYLTATATDPQGDTSAYGSNIAVGSAGSTDNLVTNPSFEADLRGWFSWQASRTRVRDGVDGDWAARVVSTCAAGQTCKWSTLYDAPPSVAGPQAGQAYTATAWVKGEGASVGSRVGLVLTEQGGAAPAATSTATVTLTSTWQQVQISRTVARADRGSLSVSLTEMNPTGGDAYRVDAVSLVRQ